MLQISRVHVRYDWKSNIQLVKDCVNLALGIKIFLFLSVDGVEC